MADAIEPTYMAWARERWGKPDAALRPPEPRTLPSAGGHDRHPVLAALPPEVRLAVYRRGHLRMVEAGERMESGCGVLFVLNGVIGLFPDNGLGICLGLAGPGSVVNAEDLTQGDTAHAFRVLAKGAVLALSGPDLAGILGRDRADNLLIEQILAQQAALEREVVCNALHLAPARLARWLLMLTTAVGGGGLHITQAALAEMLGIQRTSVNAASRSLQVRGGLRFVRGRVRILKPEVLRAQACECFAASQYGPSGGAVTGRRD